MVKYLGVLFLSFISTFGVPFVEVDNAGPFPPVYNVYWDDFDNINLTSSNKLINGVQHKLYELSFSVFDDENIFYLPNNLIHYNFWSFNLPQTSYVYDNSFYSCGIHLYMEDLYFSFDLDKLNYLRGSVVDNSYGYNDFLFYDTVNNSGEEVFTIYLLTKDLSNLNFYDEFFMTTAPLSYVDDIYEKAYDDGYNIGFSNGSSYGFNRGYRSGYNDGYSLGEQKGFNDGYNEGFNFSTNGSMFSWIRSMFQAVSDIFMISLFGDFTIGTLALIMITFTLVPFIIGLFKGGNK